MAKTAPMSIAAKSGPLPAQMNRLAVNAMALIPQDVEQTIRTCEGGSLNGLQSVRSVDFSVQAMPCKCANPTCTEDIKDLWTRVCGMCGHTFCYSCTTEVRKLSATGQPDPLGKEKRVCAKCSNLNWEDGQYTDMKELFHKYRLGRPKVATPPPPEPEKPVMEEQKGSVLAEAERLTRGYQANCSGVKGLMSDFVVPSWQKSDNWQSSRSAKECEACKGPLKPKKLGQKAKVNCRLCGKIFCADCTKSEILLYMTDEGVAKWAINGKEGAPTTKPPHYELLSICNFCCSELESAILSDIMGEVEDVHATKASDFSDSLRAMQKLLMSLLHRIEQLLVEYRKLVDCFTAKSQNTALPAENPVHVVAKTQCHLNSILSKLNMETSKLKSLHPSTRLQEKLLRNISTSFITFYMDNLCLYRQYQEMLSKIIPNDVLQAIQSMVCRGSMEDTHRELNIIMYNGLELKSKYRYSDTVLMPIVAVMQVCEKELQAMDSEAFKLHCQAVKEDLESAAKNHPMFSVFVKRKVSNGVMAAAMFCHVAAGMLRDTLKVLLEKTVESECQRTKEALKDAISEVASSESVYRKRVSSLQVSKPLVNVSVPDTSVSKPGPSVPKLDSSIGKVNTSASKLDLPKSVPKSDTSVAKEDKSVSKPDKAISKSELKISKPVNTSTSSKSP